MNNKFSLFFCLLFTVLTSCTKKDTYQYIAPTYLIPLEITNYWQYTDKDTYSSSSAKHFVRCIDTFESQNLKWYRIHDYNDGSEKILTNTNDSEVLINSSLHGIYTYYKYEPNIDTFTK